MGRSSLIKRLAKLEKACADRARREELVDCNCPELSSVMPFLAFAPEQFEAEMNKTCPVHGFRRLGQLLAVVFVNTDRTLTEESVKLNELVETYDLRLSQLDSSGTDEKF